MMISHSIAIWVGYCLWTCRRMPLVPLGAVFAGCWLAGVLELWGVAFGWWA